MSVDPKEFFNEDTLRFYFNLHLKKKKGGGRDHLTPVKFWELYENKMPDIAQKCLDGSYKFSYYNEKLIVKSSKKNPRVLSIPTMRDQLVLGVLKDYLSEVFADCVPHQIPNGYIMEVASFLAEKEGSDVYFLRTDFHDFYGSLNIKKLMNMVSVRITDTSIQHLIYDAITTPTISGNKPHKRFPKPNNGIPQGLAISNILAAIYMKSFDIEYGANCAEKYFRYVDDILFLNPKTPTLYRQMLKEIQRRNLRLRMSPEKCKAGIVGRDSLDFLGYTISDYIFIRKKNVTSFISRIAGIISKYKSGLEKEWLRPQFIKETEMFIEYYIEELNLTISGFKFENHLYGWMPYFQAITDVSSLYGMDNVIRKRIMSGLSKDFILRINNLVDTYYDIRRNHGKNMLRDYDSLESTSEKMHYLAKRGLINRDKEYTSEQINLLFRGYIDYIRSKSEQHIGRIS